MKICADCFDDTDFKTRIQSLNRRAICDIHKKKEYVFDTDADSQLNIQTDLTRLLNLYEVVDLETEKSLSHIDMLQNKTLIDRLQSDWQIFSSKLSNSEITDIICVLLRDSFNTTLSTFFRMPLRMKEIYDPKFIKENSILIGDSWAKFKENILHKNRFFNKDLNMDLLADLMGFSITELKPGQTFYRARIVDDFSEIKTEKDVLIPPKNKINRIEGRLNPRGIGMLYLANAEDTALKEVRASFNDNVIVVPIKIKKSIKVVDLTQIMHVSPFIMLDTKFPEIYQLNKEIISTFINELEKPVNSHPINLDYLPTQYLSAIAQKRYDGIKYRSTMKLQDSSDYDVVLFSDKDVTTSIEEIRKYQINKVEYGWKKALF